MRTMDALARNNGIGWRMWMFLNDWQLGVNHIWTGRVWNLFNPWRETAREGFALEQDNH